MEARRKTKAPPQRSQQELPRTTVPTTDRPGNDSYDGGGDELRKHHRGGATVASRTIHWIESRKVPSCVARRRRGAAPAAGEKEDLYFVTGLRKVLYGTQPAADVVRIAGIRPPRFLCYTVSGATCDVIQFLMYVLFYNRLRDASSSWALSFGSSIVFRHTTHRYLVFGDYVGGYWRSLRRMYGGYSIIIVLSTVFNFVITKHADMPHVVAWILTLSWTGIVNYFILKKLWSFGGGKKENETKEKKLSRDNNSENDIELSSNNR